MKDHLGFKFAAIVLTALALLGSVLGIVGVVCFMDLGIYTNSLEQLQDQQMLDDLELLSEDLAVRYAAANLSNCTKTLVEAYSDAYFDPSAPRDGQWFYVLKDEHGQVLESRGAQQISGALEYEFLIAPEYPRVIAYQEGGQSLLPDPLGQPQLPPEENPGGDGEMQESFIFQFYEEDTRKTHVYTLSLVRGPVYLVQLYLLPGAYEQEVAFNWELMAIAHDHRYDVFLPLLLCLLTLGVGCTYLCSTAGRKPGTVRLRPAALNRLPLDVYLAITGFTAFFLVRAYIRVVEKEFTRETAQIICVGIALTAYAACLLAVGCFFAFAAQLKQGGGHWWRHTALCYAWKLLRRWLRSLRRMVGFCAGGLKKAGRSLSELVPLTWQWILWLALVLAVLIAAVWSRNPWAIGGAVLFAVVSLLYVLHAYRLLLGAVKRMSQGDLETPVDKSQLMGGFVDFATYLNALADVAVVAAQKEMRSERMRAELITNVSHDIKTPLTSIINYVDLLGRAPDRESADQYLEVLSRQSLRMKKLIDDLIELSKATTGNLPVNLQEGDAAEYLAQALGEFDDKLTGAGLTTVYEPPAGAVPIRCDGRLTWRVLSNLLSNAVKYALPGTRLYVDLEQREGEVRISLKNISKEPLNVSSEELMERFVRGDRSRNTEGSGLGLNIAKSLMELQRGNLELLVDGDLFKATVVFPRS